ncbi:hypothetical protein, partial [Leptospira noguchii]|uniref:hypothetical protein n=1 Tax=Leptospira noguchii TaxID=28182 RepID=UPI0009E62657
APIPSEFFKLNAAHYGSQHNNRFRICYAELTLNTIVRVVTSKWRFVNKSIMQFSLEDILRKNI